MNRLTQYTHLALLALLALVAGGCGVEGRSALGAQEAMGGGDPEVVARRVLDLAAEQGTDVLVSPDGRHVAYTLWEDDIGTLMLRELHGGPTDGQVIREGVAQHHPWVTRFSRDAKRLAFMQAVPEGGYELRTIDTDGSREQLLVAMDRPELPVEWAEAYDWSPDGTKLLVSFWMADKTTHLALLSPDNGSSTILKTFDWRAPSAAAFSPDGQFVAYDFQADEDKRARDIYVLGTDGSREIRLTDDPGVKRLTGWSRDAGAIYYAVEEFQDGNTVSSVWRLPVREARPAGPPTLVQGDLINARNFVFGGENLFYKVEFGGGRSVWTVSLDLESGRVVVPPAPLISGAFRPGQMSWMPDGVNFAYFRSPQGERPGLELVLHSTATGEARVIPLGLDVLQGHTVWSDGSLLVRGQQRGRPGYVRVDPTSGQVSTVEDPALIEQLDGPMRFRRFSPDLSMKYFARERDGGAEIVGQEIQSGSEHVLYRVDGGAVRVPVLPGSTASITVPVLSPDGTHLAFVVRHSETRGPALPSAEDRQLDELQVIPTIGGKPVLLHTLARPGFIGAASLNWTADSRALVFRDDTGEGVSRVWKVDIQGGDPLILLTRPFPITDARLHPDGRRLTFVAPAEGEPISELWVLENLPESRAGAARPR